MFGGIAFMVAGYMCCGVGGEELTARAGPEQYAVALKEPHVREMDLTGKPQKGFIQVDVEGLTSDTDLESWIARCLQFVRSLPPR